MNDIHENKGLNSEPSSNPNQNQQSSVYKGEAGNQPSDISSAQNQAAKADRIAAAKPKLRELLLGSDTNLFAAGDLLIELTQLGASLADLAAETGWTVSRLSELRSAAEAFVTSDRATSVTFFSHEKARYAANKTAREVRKHLKQNPSEEVVAAISSYATPNPVAALKAILEIEKASGRKLNKRDATNLISKAVHAEMKKVAALAKPQQDDPILNQCHLIDCNTFLRALGDNPPTWKPKLINLDPPYGVYRKLKDGHLDVNSSAAQHKSGSNLAADEALKTTVETIELLPPIMSAGTAVLLWQGPRELRLPILQAIEKAELEVEIGVVWDKKRPQPGDFSTAWTQQTEMCWVLKRRGDELLNHDQSSRRNVLGADDKRFWFAQVAGSIVPTHVWAKPISMMEFFVGKHTNPGDIVLDLYGCTGSCAIAAANMGRPFVYCESFKENYDAFSPNVLAALENAQKIAAQSNDDQTKLAADTEKVAA